MQVLTFFNEKGGVGKTTIAGIVGAGLSMRDYRVLMLDADGQGDLTATMNLNQSGAFYDFCMRDVPIKELIKRVPAETCPGSLYVIPGNKETWGIPTTTNLRDLVAHMNKRLNSVAKIFDYVVIDTQPSATMMHDAIGLVTDWFIVPTDPEPLAALGALNKAFGHIQYIREQSLNNNRDKAKLMSIIPNKVRHRTNLHDEIMASLVDHKQYGQYVQHYMPLRTAIPESQLKKTFLMHYAPELQTTEILWGLIDYVEGKTQEQVTNG